MRDCKSYCSHGGVCTLPKKHGGKHDASGECQWTDAEAVSQEVGDALYAEKDPLMFSLERSLTELMGLAQREETT